MSNVFENVREIIESNIEIENRSPFYKWLFGNKKRIALIITIFIFTIFYFGIYSHEWNVEIFKFIKNKISLDNGVLLCNLSVGIVGYLYFLIESALNQKDITKLSSAIEKIVEKDEFYKHIKSDNLINKEIPMSIKVHNNFAIKLPNFYILLFISYSLHLIKNNIAIIVNLDHQIAVSIAVDIIMLIINCFWGYWFIKIYYELTYPFDESNFVKSRVKFLATFAILLGIGLISIDLYRQLNFNCNINDFKYTEIISSIFASLAFIVFVGKLDSGVFGTPTPILWLLYTYGVIQTTEFLFFWNESLPGLQTTVLIMAFFLKIILSLYLLWLVRKERLILYFLFEPYLNKRTMELRDKISKVIDDSN